MSNCKKAKEEIKVKLDKGIFRTCPKPNTATAHWWKTFVRIKDDQDIVLPFVQCVKCFSVFAYDSTKTGSSTHKLHAEACLGGGVPSSGASQDIVSMMNKENRVSADVKRLFTEACAIKI